jgi:hypothetical protein
VLWYARLMMLGLAIDEGARAIIERLVIAFQLNLGLDRALNLSKIFNQLVIPCYLQLLDFVCIPYAGGRLICALYASSSYVQQTKIMRLSFHIYACIRLILYFLSKILEPTLRQIQQLRESFFLVETQLTNRSQ